MKRKVSLKTAKRLLKIILENYKIPFIIVGVCLIVSSVANVLGSLFIQTLIDVYITPLLLVNNPIFSGLLKAILTMTGIYAVGVICTYISNRLTAKISQGTMKKIRDDMFSKMEKLPISYFDTNSHGDVMSHYTNDIDTLRQMFSHSLPQFMTSSITIVAVLFAMIYVSIPLTIFIVVFAFIMIKVTGRISSKSSTYFLKQQDILGKTNGYIEEMINGQKVVKVFTYEERSKKRFDQINNELHQNQTKANTIANILMPVLNNLGNVEYVLVAVIGASLCISGLVPSLTVGAIASFLILTKSFNQPINQISNQLNSVIVALAGGERIFELTDEAPEQDEGYVTLVNANIENGKITESKKRTGKWAWKHQHHDGRLEYIELKGDIVFENVDFGYVKDKIVLHDISLYAKPGQKIAFVGSTGAGKTTITNLLNRFYDINKGKIRYDGINIEKINKKDLRKSFGMVLQDTNLFTGTIKENIKYGKADATDEEVINAAKIANADHFIKMLPNGYDTMLTSNGSELSQGQRQLIAIARTAINNPPVMILDEATSSIDTRTEKIVQSGMDKLMDNRTVLVIAHRLSTVRNSKAIIVLENGRIIERGDHEELLKQKGEYYELYTGSTELE